jgi:hypothetical protein
MYEDLFSSVFANAQTAAGAVPAVLGEWLATMATRGAAKIAVRLLAQDPCSHVGCDSRQFGAVRCLRCERVVCLHHVALIPTGDGICLACAGFSVRGPDAPKDRADVLAAFAFLGLDPVSATAESFKKHVKRLLRDLHPDKVKEGTPDHARAMATYKQVSTAATLVAKARKWA